MYDAIVIGARVAGAATAMLLARKGFRTLLIDRASFPSDTLSTHLIQTSGVALLASWGLLDRLRATGCPPFKTNRLDWDSFFIEGSPPPAAGGIDQFYAPRRTILDKLLIDAAVEAGAEFREECMLEGILHNGSIVSGVRCRHRGSIFEEKAAMTIGADGKHSLIARLVAAPEYDRVPSICCAYYAYWTGLPTMGLEVYFRPRFTLLLVPTHDNMTAGVLMAPLAEYPRIRMDVERAFQEELNTIPALRERFGDASRQTSFAGTSDLPNFYRRPYGEGWALVGDAGYHKDPYTAQGITDAFQHADLLANALNDGFGGSGHPKYALENYEKVRNESTRARYQLTCQMATHQPPPPLIGQILAALPGNQPQTNRFLGIFAVTVAFDEFFSASNIAEIMNAGPAQAAVAG